MIGNHPMQHLSAIHIVIAAVLGLAMSSAPAVPRAPVAATFDVDGLTLSTPFDAFQRLYPEAEITEQTAARYCYGRKINIGSLSRLSAVVRRGRATVRISFDYKSFGQRILTINRDEIVEFDFSGFTSLRNELVQRYGPYTAMKYPKKMDPAGLIVGFEWSQRGAAYLSVTVHRNHERDSGYIHLTTLLTRSLPGMDDHGAAADYYRNAVLSFRKKCVRR